MNTYTPADRFCPNKRRIADGDRKQLTNQECAEQALEALKAISDSDQLSHEETITDLLANLMHLCDREKIDLNVCFAGAVIHHDCEK